MDDKQSPAPLDEFATRLDPRNLRGLAHPLRLRLLGLLREEGAATASMLAARSGESSGATSYHLRQLAAFGFIQEDPDRGTARERWWRAARPNTSFDEAALSEEPIVGAEFLRAVATAQTDRTLRWIKTAPEAPDSWRGAGTLSDWALDLDAGQARALAAEIAALIARYPRFDPEAPRSEGRDFVAVQVQILPKLSRPRP
jgi:DNA-binding transcriptional ArsR family regulator